MVWVVEKKVLRYVLDMGFERIEIPLRVKFEFEVREGAPVPDTLSREILYNRKVLETRYPKLRPDSLNGAIEEMVEQEIREYLERWRPSPARQGEEP